MKTSRASAFTRLAALAAMITATASAAPLYWGVDTASSPLWATTSSWYTDLAGTSVSSAAPTASDDVFFNTTTFNSTAVVPRLGAAAAVNSITFSSTASVNVQSNGTTARDLTIGAGGVTMDSGAAASTLGASSATINVRFGADQTWTNNASTTLNIRNNAASATGAGAVTLTLNAASTGTIQNQGTYNDGTGSTLAIIVASTGTGSVSISSGSYSGGTTIKSGTATTSGTFGTGSVLLGDTSGSANATANINTATANSNNITVQAGSSGTKTLGTNNAATVLNGNITLDDNLTLASIGASTTLNGIVSGVGGLTKTSSAVTVVMTGANTYTGATTIQGGTLSVGSLNSVSGPNHVSSSNLGAPVTVGNGTIALGSTTVAGSLKYTGSGETTDRVIDLAGTTGGATLDQSGTGLVKFTSALTATGAGIKTLTLTGSTAGTGEISGAIVENGGAGKVTKTGTGTWTLSGANTYTGVTAIQNGSLSVFSLNSVTGGTASSSLGAPITLANGTIALGTTTTSGQLTYVGTGETTDRVINLAGTTGGGTIDQSGTGLLKFTSAFTATGTGIKTLTLQGSTTGTGEIGAAIVNKDVTNKTSVTKDGTGTWTLSGNNSYTGATTIDAGILALGAANRIADTSNLIMAGGTFATGGFNETLGTLTLSASSTIDLGSGASALVFADSSGTTWGTSISLSFVNFNTGVDTIRVGTSAGGLTGTQLALISINGSAATIDSSGFLAIAIPEPSTYALFAGSGLLLFSLGYRRRARRATNS
ncbi:MAG: autotransporter-associated beta strand repeat-containing protein [Opitutaceae bacterium]|jgi:autotransporter-associated beta strand protein